MTDAAKQLGRIGVLMGGYSSEREISLKSGKAVVRALEEAGCEVVGIDIKERELEQIKTCIEQHNVDVAFIALHGQLGEDGQIQKILETLDIPYTGSGPEASEKALHKSTAQKIFQKKGILVPSFMTLLKEDSVSHQDIKAALGDWPLVVKPSREGSSIGISIVQDDQALDEAFRLAWSYGPEALIEQYIKGRELTVGVLGNQALPVIEIKSQTGFFDFSAKYQKGQTIYLVPAPLEKDITARLQQAALKAHEAIGCEGFSRVDIMLDEQNRGYVLEINTIPGFTDTSLLPMAAQQAQYSFRQLVMRIIQLAYAKKEKNKNTPIIH